METVNAFGLACPKPLMMAKAKIDEGARELSVHVDNEIAVKNVSRLAEKMASMLPSRPSRAAGA